MSRLGDSVLIGIKQSAPVAAARGWPSRRGCCCGFVAASGNEPRPPDVRAGFPPWLPDSVSLGPVVLPAITGKSPQRRCAEWVGARYPIRYSGIGWCSSWDKGWGQVCGNGWQRCCGARAARTPNQVLVPAGPSSIGAGTPRSCSSPTAFRRAGCSPSPQTNC